MKIIMLFLLTLCIAIASGESVQAMEKRAPPNVSEEQISRCAAFARALVGEPTKEEWNFNINQIRLICPGTGFECSTYYRHPQRDKCEPFLLKDEAHGAYFIDNKYGFPAKRKGRKK